MSDRERGKDCAKPCPTCGGKRYIPGKAAGNMMLCHACNGGGKEKP